jgi:hypothetical protein
MSDKFFQKYDMWVSPSNRKMRRVPRMRNYTNLWNIDVSDSAVYQHTFDVEEVDCIDVTMPADRLEELERMIEWYEQREHKIKHQEEIVEMLRRDERVRIENPAVQKAYMKYLTLLELCRK